MDAYELHEARLLQESYATTGAGATNVSGGVVPAGKIWTILGAAYTPSVAETKVCFWAIYTRGGNIIPITTPVSIALSADIPLPIVTEGMEIKLYPGERLKAYRDSATAGSTMYIAVRFIESDLPFYAYEEPLKKVVKTAQRRGSTYRSSGGISEGGGGVGGGSEGGERGGGGRGEPI